MQIAPSAPAGTGSPRSPSTATSKPGTGTDGDPGFTGSGSRPRGLAQIGQPVSVCHQLSIPGTPSVAGAPPYGPGASRSPARNSVRSDDTSCAASSSARGSSFL